MLNFHRSNADPFLPQDWLLPYEGPLTLAAHLLATHSGPGGDFTGWVALPRDYDKDEFARIQAAAEKIRRQSQVLVVIGIGGSYLGARAVLELLRSPNYDLKKKDTPDIYFAGNGLSSAALAELLDLIGDGTSPSTSSPSRAPPPSPPWLSASSGKSWRPSTARRVPASAFMPPPTPTRGL